MSGRDLTEQDRAEIRTRYVQGQSAYQLGRRFRVDESVVRRELDLAGIPRRAVVAKIAEEDQVIVDLVDKDGYSWSDLGRRLGITRGGAMQRYRRAKARLDRVSESDRSVTGS